MSASDPSPSGPLTEGDAAPRRQRILMIDDDQALTSVVKMALEGTGEYEVLTEHEPVRAVATARKFQPDLILLDLIMPQLDGGDISLDLTHEPTLADVPVIILSALVSNFDRSGGGMVKQGDRLMMAKPIRLETLRQCIAEQLSRGRKPAQG